MDIADLTNTNLFWLLSGQHYTQTDWLTANQSVEMCSDNSMSPTINEHTPVVIEMVNVHHLPIVNNIYCLESSQGRIFRRLQWDEEKQGFWLRCDNLHFEPQFSQTPNIVGKVIGALTPVI
ncbi:S24/S26 family peptidase [Vibrio parahaemolyticus]|nr:S24/S26 family peptidase [Vibrio parahaemolyticus]HBB9944292.1 S24/S26 family peptidase [Vibrio parahaemolyticus]HBC3416763.1 S24/S26 family peptidase [Vibrio parahaemolyticus]HBC3602245.1 S24/S26 family peptidase [Vibrio parahaemolyticus]HBC3878315.1 S24/S26 family peptidase [Vibrio parahaemolyticus]